MILWVMEAAIVAYVGAAEKWKKKDEKDL